MRKVECEFHLDYFMYVGNQMVTLTRKVCGHKKTFDMTMQRAAGLGKIKEEELPPCTCPLIPDDVEMSVC